MNTQDKLQRIKTIRNFAKEMKIHGTKQVAAKVAGLEAQLAHEQKHTPRLGKSATVKAAAEATGVKYIDVTLRDLLSDYDISED